MDAKTLERVKFCVDEIKFGATAVHSEEPISITVVPGLLTLFSESPQPINIDFFKIDYVYFFYKNDRQAMKIVLKERITLDRIKLVVFSDTKYECNDFITAIK